MCSSDLSWTDKISHAEFAHNHHPHSVTNQSPFYLMIGYKRCALPSLISDSSIPAVKSCLKSLIAAQDEALATHKLACRVMSSHNNQGFTPFAKGDKVWLEARNLKHSIANPKFASKHERPFMIVKVLSSITYQLCLPKHGKFITHSMLPFSHRTKKTRSTARTSQLHHPI